MRTRILLRSGMGYQNRLHSTKILKVPEGAVGYCEHCVLGWNTEEVYNVVENVDEYKKFLPWCVDSKVVAREGGRMKAELEAGFSMFSQKYSSTVSLHPHERITARLAGNGKSQVLLEYLNCHWEFTPITPKTTDVNFEVMFKFHNPIHQQLSGLVLSQVVETMVTSFVARLIQLHGPPSVPTKPLPLKHPSLHNAEGVSPTPSYSELLKLM
eukprot:TRINITY_DN4430_c0_g1_i1.p1 TRINITY_DN4430_c0_g1~~TRINITY_DN4430_c0_g1_i1.p1  ORF type:complete len:212 (+),score=11.95 TRINITY_DN4430_c0_g1_i1:133-768(+)